VRERLDELGDAHHAAREQDDDGKAGGGSVRRERRRGVARACARDGTHRERAGAEAWFTTLTSTVIRGP